MFNFKIILSDFHGGGLVSRHKTAQSALGAHKKLTRGNDCVCGCYTVIGLSHTARNELVNAINQLASNPYYYRK